MTHPPQLEPSLIEIPTDLITNAIRSKLWHQGLDVRSVGFYSEDGQLIDIGRVFVKAIPRQDRQPLQPPPKAPVHPGRLLLWLLVVILTGNLIYAVLKNFL